MLQDVSPSKQNVMRLSKADGQVKSEKRPLKRPRLSSHLDDETGSHHDSPPLSPRRPTSNIPDSDDDGGDGGDEAEDLSRPSNFRKTDLEAALPLIDENAAAIGKYEAHHENESTTSSAKWIPGRSSIYVDAFNLALDTVLEDESRLFDEAENSVFQHWRDLNYEAQYLYVAIINYPCPLMLLWRQF